MRELTEAEQRAAYETFNHLYDTGSLLDHLHMVEYAFAAGLDYRQAALEADNERLKLQIKARDALLIKMGIDPAQIKI